MAKNLTKETLSEVLEQTDCNTDAASPQTIAETAGLRYVTDTSPGIQRVRHGKHFGYVAADGKAIHEKTELERIRALKIPPAWNDVWICPDKQGHIQATGRDSRGRKQYRYHNAWRNVRDETKYEHLIPFGESLADLRKQVESDLQAGGLSQTKVLATMARLLDLTLIRVGNEEYAQSNHSFGLTTLRTRHVDIHGKDIHLHFRGKRGIKQNIELQEKDLARILKRCQDLPGQEFFQYLDSEGVRHSIGSSELNAYLRSISGQEITAKDFRTWGATVLVLHSLREAGKSENESQAKSALTQAIKVASEHLGNTPAICRKCYVHPGIIESYLDGSLFTYLEAHPRQVRQHKNWELHPDEDLLLHVLHYLAEQKAA